jgi:hypothetical protein
MRISGGKNLSLLQIASTKHAQKHNTIQIQKVLFFVLQINISSEF